jgi:CRP-like cAMP-binding protein
VSFNYLCSKKLQIPYFKDGSIGFLHQLALMVKFRDFKDQDVIIKKDDVGDSMFFVLDGKASVVSPDGKQVYAELGTNSFFGEVSLFYSTTRTATVRASGHTTVIEISKSVLESVLDQHPELKEAMMKKAKENYDSFQHRQNALKELRSSAKQNAEEYDIEATVGRLRRVCLDFLQLKALLILKTSLGLYF